MIQGNMPVRICSGQIMLLACLCAFPTPASAEEPLPRELLVRVKEAVWLEDYEAARLASRKMQAALGPKDRAFFAPFLEPFEYAATNDPAVLATGLRALRERAARVLPPNAIDPAAKIYLGMLLIRAGREDEALEVLESVPEYSEDHLWMYRIQKAHLLSRLYAERRQWNLAAESLNRAMQLLPFVEESTRIFENSPAICHVFRIRIEQVHDQYLREVDPARWRYKQYIQAALSGDRKRKAQALEHYQSLLEEHPRDYWAGRAAFERALHIWEEGKEAEAAQAWQNLIATNPRAPWRGHALLALADYRLVVQFDLRAALALYQQAWETSQDETADITWRAVAPSISGRLAGLLSVSGTLQADRAPDAKSVLLVDPPSRSRLALSEEVEAELKERGQWLEPSSTMLASRAEGFAPRLSSDKAAFPPDLLRELSLRWRGLQTPASVFLADHAEPGLLLALGDLAISRDAPQAKALFSRVLKGAAISVHPVQEEYAGRRIADVLIAQGEYGEAAKHLTHLVRRRSRADRPALMLSLARIYATSLGKPADALVLLKELLAEHAESTECVEAQFLLGKTLLAQRQWQQASDVLEKLQKGQPEHPWSREVIEVLLPLAKNQGVRKLTKDGPVKPSEPPADGPPQDVGAANAGKKAPPKFVPVNP